MSERLADIGRRIAIVHQLGAVVNAMRGIAGARASQSRALLPAIRAYAETAVRAIGMAQRLRTAPSSAKLAEEGRPGLIVFGAEQGFAGAFAEQAIDAAAPEFVGHHVFLVGAKAAAIAAERHLTPDWQASLSGRADALSGLAVQVLDALYGYLASAGPVPIVMIHPVWTAGRGPTIIRRNLLPLDPRIYAHAGAGPEPLINLPADDLVARLAQDYVFALLCEAAAEAFAAENEARMATMASAKANIDKTLTALQMEERLTRQDEITAEVVELAAGARARGSRQHL
jgi:F-type H+-transporting ATPase subunit gamma